MRYAYIESGDEIKRLTTTTTTTTTLLRSSFSSYSSSSSSKRLPTTTHDALGFYDALYIGVPIGLLPCITVFSMRFVEDSKQCSPSPLHSRCIPLCYYCQKPCRSPQPTQLTTQQTPWFLHLFFLTGSPYNNIRKSSTLDQDLKLDHEVMIAANISLCHGLYYICFHFSPISVRYSSMVLI